MASDPKGAPRSHRDGDAFIGKAAAEEEARRLGMVPLSALALLVGIVTGCGAVLFRALIGLVHNLLFLRQISTTYDANLFTPSNPWGALVILVPVVGALAVTFLVSRFAPEAKGHGVPEVMDAIYYAGGVIRPAVAVVKSLASAIAIGSGAAVGREGPIIQIGSALGSTLGQLVRMAASQRITLVAAGAGAGIAATFNTPIGGVMFATELMLPEVGVGTFLPVAIATGTATFISHLALGDFPAFYVPQLQPLPDHPGAALTLALYAVLGVASGIASAAFVRGLHGLEDLFDRIGNGYVRHGLGMALVGVLIYALYRTHGHYFVEGVGYATVQAILMNQLTPVSLLTLLFVAKLGATTVSLGSGSSGGIFSPSLFMGATLGGAFASMILWVNPGAPISVASFAIVGMGAVVGGATGAVLTAITMIFEMTRDYGIIMPMILAVAFSVGVRRLLSPDTIYTAKLTRRGRPVPQALHANAFLVWPARAVMDPDMVIVPAGTPFEDFLRRPENAGTIRHVLVAEGDRIVGGFRINTGLRQDLEGVHSGITVGDVARRDFLVVGENEAIFDIIGELWNQRAMMAVVVRGEGPPRPDTVVGVITKEHIADAVAAGVKIYR